MKKNNYLVLLLMTFGTILVVYYALSWYSVYKESIKNKAVIEGYISEVKIGEFSNYISDNHNSVIYFGITDDEDCRRFENSLKDIIFKYQLKEAVVYMRLNDLKGPNLATSLDNRYGTDELRATGKYFNKIPSLGVYRNAELVEFVSGKSLTKNNAIKLLKKYNVINDWN